MRKLAFASLIVVLAVAGVLVYAALNLNAFLQGQRDWIAAQVGEALQREVHFDEIGVAWRGGLAANLSGLRVADDPRFATEPFLEVGDARLLVDLWAALRGRYEVTRVVLDRPKVRLVRTAQGFNVDSLGGGAEVAAGQPEAADGGDDSPLPLLVSLFELRDGEVRFVDRTAQPALDLTVADLNVTLAEISWGTPMRVEASARLFDPRRADVRVEGTAGPIGEAGAGAVPLDLRASVGPLSIDELKRHAALAAAIPAELSSPGPVQIEARIGGRADKPTLALALDASAAELHYGEAFHKPRGVTLRADADIEPGDNTVQVRNGVVRVAEATLRLTGNVRTAPQTRFDLRLAGDPLPLEGWDRMVPALAAYRLRGTAAPDLVIRGTGSPEVSGKVALDAVGLTQDGMTISGLTAAVAIEGERVSLPRTRFRLNDAEMDLAASYDRARAAFDVTTDLHGLVLGPLLREHAPQLARWLEGTLDAEVRLQGRGTQWEQLRDTLTGQGSARVREGRLREINLAESVVTALTGVQGLTGLLAPEVRARHADLFEARDTTFQDFSGRVRLADGRIVLDDLVLAARDQRISGSGSISLTGGLDITADIALSPALTEELVARARPVRELVRDGRLTVPFRLRGELPQARPVPDMDYVVRRVGRAAVESGLDRLLRRGAETAPPEPGDAAEAVGTGAEAVRTPTARVEEQLLRRGLDTLFGGRRQDAAPPPEGEPAAD